MIRIEIEYYHVYKIEWLLKSPFWTESHKERLFLQ